MRIYIQLSFAFILVLVSSCAFNNRFHHPVKIPMGIDELSKFKYTEDTVLFNYNKVSKRIQFYSQTNELINNDLIITSSEFLSSSQNKINTWLLSPKDKKPIATILHFHGSGGDLLLQYKAISPLVEQGFQVFTFDYSGYGFSEGKATRKNALKDAYSALDYVVQNIAKQDTKLILYGQSYGGYLAALVGSNRQMDIEGIVIEGAFSSHKEEAKYESPFWGNLVKNEQKADTEIQKNFKPVLIIHSKDDKKVPIKFGKRIYENANSPKEFYEIDEAHIQGLQYYSTEISKKIKAMINTNYVLD